MKIKGSEFMEWYDNHFPEGYFFDSQTYDDDSLSIHNDSGEWNLRPDETYDTDELGYLEPEEPRDRSQERRPDLSVDTAIRRWRKARDFDPLTIQVPKGRMEEVMALLKAHGLKSA